MGHTLRIIHAKLEDADRGMFRVLLDGSDVDADEGTFSAWSPNPQPIQMLYSASVAPGMHTLNITNLDGTILSLDYFMYVSPLLPHTADGVAQVHSLTRHRIDRCSRRLHVCQPGPYSSTRRDPFRSASIIGGHSSGRHSPCRHHVVLSDPPSTEPQVGSRRHIVRVGRHRSTSCTHKQQSASSFSQLTGSTATSVHRTDAANGPWSGVPQSEARLSSAYGIDV
ncbi:hypothetical protein EXIGLDRAFT_323202 [Exidia glandulosa HHB12029]|uniref:Uncharacterized protein n=1 Tax=Exidia glandulosa HHB12029 TaxID=1314781 RepID=A0A165ZJP9_EXIGL|nr:hypothetical protein EXIGLDRAFT_323202 [Exidia glandulosa HHB12029]